MLLNLQKKSWLSGLNLRCALAVLGFRVHLCGFGLLSMQTARWVRCWCPVLTCLHNSSVCWLFDSLPLCITHQFQFIDCPTQTVCSSL